MMVSFTSKKFDLAGNFLIDAMPEATRKDDQVRRANRIETLDGAVQLDDAGFAHGDRTFDVGARVDQIDLDGIKRIQRVYAVHLCATRDGVFEGVISSVSVNRGQAIIRFLVSRKISA